MAIQDYLESMDFVTLRQYMLDLAPEDVDSSEGSFLYDAITPIAMFVSEMFSQMKLILEQSFLGTATGSNLDTLAATMPRIYRNPATAERLTLRLIPYTPAIAAYIESNQSTLRFSNVDGEFYRPNVEQSDWLTHDSTSISVHVVKMIEGSGTAVVGNALEPSPAINDLESCVVVSIDARGNDEEDDDHFRVRVWATMSSPFLGSMADYQRKIFSEFPLSENGFRVANCFIIPRGSRSGYICVIPAKVDATGMAVHCEAGELNSLQEYLDKRVNNIGGYGLGVAPIGHVVKVRDFSDYRLHFNVEVISTSDLTNEETTISQIITTATNNYLRQIIDEVVPSSTNYRANSQRYINYFIYYYLNAHEYEVLAALRAQYGTDTIKNVVIKRLITNHITDSYDARKANEAYISISTSTAITNVYVNGEMVDASWGWSLDEISLETSLVENFESYFVLEYQSGHLIIRPNGTYTGDPVILTDLKLLHRYETHSAIEQQNIVIKSGDSKGVIPVLGDLNVDISGGTP